MVRFYIFYIFYAFIFTHLVFFNYFYSFQRNFNAFNIFLIILISLLFIYLLDMLFIFIIIFYSICLFVFQYFNNIPVVLMWTIWFASVHSQPLIRFSASSQNLITSAGTFWLFACMCGLNIIFTIIFVPETKGKTLEQIEALFKGTSGPWKPQSSDLRGLNRLLKWAFRKYPPRTWS